MGGRKWDELWNGGKWPPSPLIQGPPLAKAGSGATVTQNLVVFPVELIAAVTQQFTQCGAID